ncbi:type IV pilin protein [Bdellovibrio sp. KM01]|uniref:type IV pilin protein n=1 Tax=Bdellovibrio sp. KM01 TaxID=2748865 RepID=UPI0015EA341E|nr:prepilin-type N-terminal cleavage/methylation domain-containing protein [Bdellovibrio sp. KM01]QLY24365.1 prepilin-type N-terminal cleavage/methylation domain-containing protein [Bdellovibrio sp. KM01]
MKRTTRTSQAGFSLVELMVVVAIIGVLAAIAIPSVNKYIAKARQSEAKTNLASLYTSEKAFYAEYSAYHSMFGAVGYSPEGKLRYNVGFTAAGAGIAGAANGYTNQPTAAPGTAITTLAYCGTTAASLSANGCMILNGADNTVPAPLSGGAFQITNNQFLIGARAIIYKSAADVWSIDHNKSLTNPTPGIN